MADTKQATELIHRLWYQGVRLRDEIKESLLWHPQIWNGPAVSQLIEAWDDVSQTYADTCLSPQPSQTELRIPDDLVEEYAHAKAKGWQRRVELIERIARLEGSR